ncbi:hypothetical protein KP509_21G052100 [Ceratopteris richardii]|uniref:Sel1-like protein n=1 Tax=Ceratopteris richardii TaxID=49495 RepID=A0A8T2SDB6_CERRI|nr:hypothetical protein KP509_21G052100 [Ceratopteris richardii]
MISGRYHVMMAPTSSSTATDTSELIDTDSGKRVRLKIVVENCVKRWFEEYLHAAQEGDHEMMLLVGAMYNTGYGVQKDPAKGKYWLDRARPNHQSHKNQP